eukprot:30787-Pelagococcus_subviridis.AAC.4
MRAVALVRVRLGVIDFDPPSDGALELRRLHLPAAVVVHLLNDRVREHEHRGRVDRRRGRVVKKSLARLRGVAHQVRVDDELVAKKVVRRQRLRELFSVHGAALVDVEVREEREPLLVEVLRGFADA